MGHALISLIRPAASLLRDLPGRSAPPQGLPAVPSGIRFMQWDLSLPNRLCLFPVGLLLGRMGHGLGSRDVAGNGCGVVLRMHIQVLMDGHSGAWGAALATEGRQVLQEEDAGIGFTQVRTITSEHLVLKPQAVGSQVSSIRMAG